MSARRWALLLGSALVLGAFTRWLLRPVDFPRPLTTWRFDSSLLRPITQEEWDAVPGWETWSGEDDLDALYRSLRERR